MSHATFDSFPDACGAILARLVRDMLLHTRPRRIDGALLNVDATLANVKCTTQCPSRLETLWRWSEYGEYSEAPICIVADAVRNTIRGHQKESGVHRNLLIVDQEKSLAFDDVVNLVHSSVCVKWMLLAGFKSVESDEDML